MLVCMQEGEAWQAGELSVRGNPAEIREEAERGGTGLHVPVPGHGPSGQDDSGAVPCAPLLQWDGEMRRGGCHLIIRGDGEMRKPRSHLFEWNSSACSES